MRHFDLKAAVAFCKEVFSAWVDSKSPRLGAALAYYTVFAVAPLLILSISIAGFCFGKTQARAALFNEINQLIGADSGRAVQSLVTAAANRPKAGLWATGGAIVTLAAGATALFVELQDALNTIWGVERKPGRGVRDFIKDRLLSFGMVLGIGFLLLVSLIINATISNLGRYASGAAPERHYLWVAINFLVSLGVITVLFAMVLKVLPDVKIAWKDVWLGAFVTAFLFNLGKDLIGLYLGRSSMVSVYGAAGSFVVLLLWVYYSAQILLLGAEFICVYTRRAGRSQNKQIVPRSPEQKTTREAARVLKGS